MTGPHCASTITTGRSKTTQLGYRTFFCRDCRRTFNERTGSTPIKGGWARKGLNKAGSCGIFSERDDQIASGETPHEPADPILPQSALSNKRKGW
jgi:hypothetical protein